MAKETVRVEGLRELQRAFKNSDRELAKQLTRELKDAADIVRQDAVARFMRISPASAAGFRPRARIGNAAVEQSRKRTTGKRGDFGALQMNVALLPALQSKQDEVIDHIDAMLDRIGKAEGF